LKQARAHSAAQQHADETKSISALVTICGRFATENKLRLRTWSLDMSIRRCLKHGNRRGEIGASRGRIEPAGLAENVDQLLVLYRSSGGYHDVTGSVRRRMQRAQVADRERGNGVACSENAIAITIVAEQLFVVDLEHEIVRCVVHHRDLLDHDLPLQLEIGRAKYGAKDEIANHIRRVADVLVQHARLIRRVLARSVRVQRAAERLQRKTDFLG